MADIWKKITLFYFGMNKLQQKIFPPVVLLIIVFLIVRWASKPQYGIVFPNGEQDSVFKRLDENEIKSYLDAITDTRDDVCQTAKYDGLKGDTLSIILDFHEHQFYDLKMTLESLIRHTPDNLYNEIILLDDGTGLESVRKDAIAFLNEPRFHKLKAFRSEQSHGSSLSRFKAAKVATGSILVFVSSEVAVNAGWLEPLIDAVQSDSHLVAIPHSDSLLSGYRFFKTPDHLINTMDWKLWTLFKETTEQKGRMLQSPVMTGSVFAINRRHLESIGSFDESMGKGGGESLELSLRIWMCGGSIRQMTCSRVAVRNALSPHEIMTPKNFRRIVELWFDNHKMYAYRQGNHSYGMDESEKESLQSRRTYLRKTVTCGSFETYLKNVLPDLMIPPADSRHFGKIKALTGYCLSTEILQDSGRIKMTQCRPHMYEKSLLFTLTTKGHIKCPYQECLTATSNGLKFDKCDDSNRNQKWQQTKDNHLMLSSDEARICLAHGIEYSQSNNHFLELKDCVPNDRSHQWTFIKY